MLPTANRQVRLKSRSGGIPEAGHFEIATAPSERIAALCLQGVTVYYGNTSGAISDAVMPHLAGKRLVRLLP